MSNETWIRKEIDRYVAAWGDVPPHWIVEPESHPYSIQWRMGGGEEFVMVYMAWFEECQMSREERIAYFRKYPPPPRWLEHVADLIFDLAPEDYPDFDYGPWFEKLRELGFAGIDDFEKDMDDPRWS